MSNRGVLPHSAVRYLTKDIPIERFTKDPPSKTGAIQAAHVGEQMQFHRKNNPSTNKGYITEGVGTRTPVAPALSPAQKLAARKAPVPPGVLSGISSQVKPGYYGVQPAHGLGRKRSRKRSRKHKRKTRRHTR
jgi:hypothetical protein